MTDDYYRSCPLPKPEPRCITRKRAQKVGARDERTCRELVRQRDKGRCQIPGCVERGRMHQHHIVYRSHAKALKFSPENRTTLCLDHHRLVHAGVIQIVREADGELIVTGDVEALKFRL